METLKQLASKIMEGNRYSCQLDDKRVSVAGVRDDRVLVFDGNETLAVPFGDCSEFRLIATGVQRRVKEVQELAVDSTDMGELYKFLCVLRLSVGEHLALSEKDAARLVDFLQEEVLEFFADDIQQAIDEAENA